VSAGLIDLEVFGTPGTLSPNYSLLSVPYAGGANNLVGDDPLFANPVPVSVVATPNRFNAMEISVQILPPEGTLIGFSDYHLQPGSPAIDAGAASFGGVTAPCFDYDYDGRPFGAAHDIGADEQPGRSIPFMCPAETVFLSLTDGATLGGVAYADEDILAANSTTFAMFFDGSDVGVASHDIDAFAVVDANTLLMSFEGNGMVPGISGVVADSDIVAFEATSLGSATAGTFSLFFDGSDVGLTTVAEDITAIELLPNGQLIISTLGDFSVPGLSGPPHDLIACTGAFGPATTCTWSWYFDGSDIGLGPLPAERIDATAVGANGAIYLSTPGNFTVPGLSGANEDVFACTPTSLGSTTICTYISPLFFDGSTRGLGGNDVDAIDVP
jgi:hypothetical protein